MFLVIGFFLLLFLIVIFGVELMFYIGFDWVDWVVVFDGMVVLSLVDFLGRIYIVVFVMGEVFVVDCIVFNFGVEFGDLIYEFRCYDV